MSTQALGSTREPQSIENLSANGLLWYQTYRVALNPLDSTLCTRVYQSYLRRESALFVYPISSYIFPSLAVATLLVDSFGKTTHKELTPRILFYTGIDGRDLYADLGVGPERVKISEAFGIVRLNSYGLPLEQTHLTSNQPLVVTGHCVLPKDKGYTPQVIVLDASTFNADSVTDLIAQARSRWPAALFYVVTADPLTPLVRVACDNKWRVIDLLRKASTSASPARDHPFSVVSSELSLAAAGIKREVSVPSEAPTGSWTELLEPIAMARRSAAKSATARQFLASTKWLCSLSVLPSEFETYSLSNMTSFENRLTAIRESAKSEGRNAALIAGAVTLLEAIYRELEQKNCKRDVLNELIANYIQSHKTVTVVTERHGMRAVLSQAIQTVPRALDAFSEGRLTVVSVSQLHKARLCDVAIVPAIFAARSMWALRVAIAPVMHFVAYGIECSLLQWCLREVGLLSVADTLLEVAKDGAEAEVEEDQAFLVDLAAIVRSEETEYNEAQGSAIVAGPRRLLSFDDGTSLLVADGSFVQTIVDSEEPIQQKRATQIRPGDTVLVINGGVQESLFELLRDRVDTQTSLSRAIDIVKAFQRTLALRVAESKVESEVLHERLIGLGSTIVSSQSIMQWIEGIRFGPSDAQDIRRLGAALGAQLFVDRYAQFYSAMQRVRIAHRELGKVLVRVLKSMYGEGDTRSIKISVDGENVILYDVADAVELKRVAHVREAS